MRRAAKEQFSVAEAALALRKSRRCGSALEVVRPYEVLAGANALTLVWKNALKKIEGAEYLCSVQIS
jgi:hypothetical protein